MKVEVNGHIFEAELCEGETAAAFASLLPLRLYMQELNGNRSTITCVPRFQMNPRWLEPFRQATLCFLTLRASFCFTTRSIPLIPIPGSGG